MPVETTKLVTSDRLLLEGELARPEGDVRAGCVLCHPHPQFGGTMRSLVIGELFSGLAGIGATCVRFNFRGVEASEGSYADGDLERLDVLAALDGLVSHVPSGVPILVVGWSFGGDMALSTHDPRISGWFGIAPPLRFARDLDHLAADPRPKLLALAERDQFRPAEEIRDQVGTWKATDSVVVGGADHFFVGRTGRLVQLGTQMVERLVAQPGR